MCLSQIFEDEFPHQMLKVKTQQQKTLHAVSRRPLQPGGISWLMSSARTSTYIQKSQLLIKASPQFPAATQLFFTRFSRSLCGI